MPKYLHISLYVTLMNWVANLVPRLKKVKGTSLLTYTYLTQTYLFIFVAIRLV